MDNMVRSAGSFRGPMKLFNNQRLRKSLFVAGFVENQVENQSLSMIVHDLLPYYYVSQNPMSTQSWTRATCREMVDAADAVIFFIHEASLSDKRCLLVLQTAWELMAPLIMLRHPRMKLLIKTQRGSKSKGIATIQGTNGVSLAEQNEPDMSLLRDILFEGYKESISYDRFQHNAGMRLLKRRLGQHFEPLAQIGRESVLSPHSSRSNGANLKLPPIVAPQRRSPSLRTPRQPRQTVSSPEISGDGNVRKSRSMSSLSDDSLFAKGRDGAKKKLRPKRRRVAKGKSKSRGDEEEDEAEKKADGDPPKRTLSDINSISSITSLDDEALYHLTKYLVFPVRDKTLKPRLINFPGDIIDGEDLKLESIWGSESSLEEEFNRADEVRGNLDFRTPSPALAPFMDPI